MASPPVAVEVAGPDDAAAVVLLGAAGQAPSDYGNLCRRLHTAALRTVVIAHDPRPTAESVVGVLDTLGIKWAVLVGDREGGDPAWELAVTRLDRFTAFIAIDSGHPRIPDGNGVVRDQHCGPVEMNTTAVVSTTSARTVAEAGQRYVLADFRLVQLQGWRDTPESIAQLASEIVMRTATW